MLDFFKKLFRNESSKVEPELENATEANEIDLTEFPKDPYGFWWAKLMLYGGGYGWSPEKEHKKVLITNPMECQGKVTIQSLAAAWNGTGKCEWEYLLAYWFVYNVLEAIEKGETEADITMLFSHDLLATDDKIFTQAEVEKHIMPLFTVVSETDEELRVRINLAA